MAKTLATLMNKYERALGNQNIEKTRTDLLPLDYVLDGGVPHGKIIEIYGENSTGKTTLSIYILSKFLEKYPDKAVVYIDAEYSFDSTWAKKNGIDVETALKNEQLFVIYPNSMDEAFDAIIDAAKTGETSLILLDSLPALAPKELYDDQDPTNFSRPGLSAKKQTNFVEMVAPLLEKTKTPMLVINQIRANISPYGASTSVPGAYAFKHMVSTRLELKKKDFLGSRDNPQGIITQIKCLKNKTGIPFRSENIVISVHKGLSIIESNVEFMINNGLISRAGSYYDINGEKVRGKQGVFDYLLEHQDAYKELLDKTLNNLLSVEPNNIDVGDSNEEKK